MVMNVSSYLNQIQNVIMEQILGSSDISMSSMSGTMWIVLGILALVGILGCFFGLKLVRAAAAILGLVLGFGVGASVAALFGLEPMVSLIIGGVVGIVLACLGAVLYRVGVFLVVWVAGCSLAYAVLVPDNLIMGIVCLVIGLVAALLTITFAEPVTMVVTGIHGAAMLGTTVSLLIPIDGKWVRIAAIVLFALFGIWVQFVMESGKRKRRNLKKAEEIREQHSTENEVEKARAVMDNLDSLQDEDIEDDDIEDDDIEDDDIEDEDIEDDDIDDDEDITYIDID